MKNSTPPIRADLHFHSTLSDGRKTPAEIIVVAKEREIGLLVNTDHDLINTETTKLAQEAGIMSFEGVEISAYEPSSDKHLHITCYAEHFSDRVHDIMTHTRNGRWDKIHSQIVQLQEKGFTIDLPWFIEHFRNQGMTNLNPANGHLAEYIYLFPQNISLVQELTWKELNRMNFLYECLKREGEYAWIGAPVVLNYEPTIELCSKIAQENNALLSIAHPNFTFAKDIQEIDTIIEPYIEMGIQWIEINAAATAEWVEVILRIKNRYGLILTFWSDCHFKNLWGGKHSELWDRNPHLNDGQYGEMVQTFIETVSI